MVHIRIHAWYQQSVVANQMNDSRIYIFVACWCDVEQVICTQKWKVRSLLTILAGTDFHFDRKNAMEGGMKKNEIERVREKDDEYPTLLNLHALF